MQEVQNDASLYIPGTKNERLLSFFRGLSFLEDLSSPVTWQSLASFVSRLLFRVLSLKLYVDEADTGEVSSDHEFVLKVF